MLLNVLYMPPYQPRIGRTQPAQRESGEDRAWNRRSVKPPTKNGVWARTIVRTSSQELNTPLAEFCRRPKCVTICHSGG